MQRQWGCGLNLYSRGQYRWTTNKSSPEAERESNRRHCQLAAAGGESHLPSPQLSKECCARGVLGGYLTRCRSRGRHCYCCKQVSRVDVDSFGVLRQECDL